MCQNLPPGDFFFFGAEKIRLIQLFVNLPTSVFFFRKKQNKKQTIHYWVVRLYSSLAGLHPRELSVTL